MVSSKSIKRLEEDLKQLGIREFSPIPEPPGESKKRPKGKRVEFAPEPEPPVEGKKRKKGKRVEFSPQPEPIEAKKQKEKKEHREPPCPCMQRENRDPLSPEARRLMQKIAKG